MSALDVSRLSGPDAIVALRSYPRRFRGAALPVDDPESEEWTYRIGPTGRSALDLVTDTTHSWILLGRSLEQVLTEEQPVLHPATADADERSWEAPPGTTIHVALEQLADAATELADTISHIHSPDWERVGTVAGGGTLTALDLAREAVVVGADGLRAVEQTIAAVGR